MTLNKMVKFFTQIYPIRSSPCRCLQGTSKSYQPICSRYYSEKSGAKGPSKVEQIEQIKMPGFVHPETMNEEGYFTQKARQQLEELKKKIDKPKVENSEKKE